MKYLFLFILVCSLSVMSFADDSIVEIVETLVENILPEQHLDNPIPTAPQPVPSTVFGIEINLDVQNIYTTSYYDDNFFTNLGLSGLNASSILNLLVNADITSSTTGNNTGFYSSTGSSSSAQNDTIAAFQADLAQFLTGFPQASEVFTMQMNAGDSTFINEVGESLTPSSENFYNEEQEFSSTDLVLYAGRYTTLNTPTNGDTGIPSEATNIMTITIGDNIYEISAFHSTSPIVLDMDGDQVLQASNGVWLPHTLQDKDGLVAFDLNGDGFDEVIEWVGPNDGLLVRYEGGVMNGHNMFGTPGGYAHGYEKLATFDQNNDRKISGSELDGFSIWQDKNGNAKVDSGEIRSLRDLNITELSTDHKYMTSYFIQNGEKKIMWDWFPATQMVKKLHK